MAKTKNDQSKNNDGLPEQTIAHEAIQAQLNRIQSSPLLAKSKQLNSFLCFVIEETLAGNADQIKEYSIAVKAFNRNPDFNARLDPIVRVQARHLRRVLSEYYLDEGRQDPVRIHIPKGSYVPTFSKIKIVKESLVDDVINQEISEPTLSQPTIAVLPFVNLSGKNDRDYFIEGLSEELATSLTRYQDLRVIAYYSSQRYRDKNKGVRQAGKELGADFVVTGSIKENNKTIRVTVHLNDSRTAEQIWVDRFERDLTLSNLFELEDEIVEQIVASIAGQSGIISRTLAQASLAKGVSDLTAYEAILRYRYHDRTRVFNSFLEAIQALEDTVQTSPDYALAWAALANLYGDAYSLRLGEVNNALEKAHTCARKAIRLNPQLQEGWMQLGYIYLLLNNREKLLETSEKIISLNPKASSGVSMAGWYMALVGEFERGIALLEKGMKLNPFYPGWYHLPFFLRYYNQGNYEQALLEANKFNLPDFFWDPLLHAVTFVHLGHLTKAEEFLQKTIQLQPDFNQYARFYISCFVMQDDLVEKLLNSLYKAGLQPTSQHS